MNGSALGLGLGAAMRLWSPGRRRDDFGDKGAMLEAEGGKQESGKL